jgi:hypothetical protein
MTDTLLRSLRTQLLDEGEPLAGLLRKCLLLGAETGSNSLRQWARFELNGYNEGIELPSYRRLPTPPISVDSISGNTWAKNMTYNRLQLPTEAQKGVPEFLPLHQPVEELEQLAVQETLSFASVGLTYAQMIWNRELGPFQEITGLSFKLGGSAIAGVLGQIRTQLVDVVADLTADTPLEELPDKLRVDAAVGQHIGTQYNTTINGTRSPLAIGTKAMAKTVGLSVDDAIKMLDAVRVAASDVSVEHRAEVLAAVEDLNSEARKVAPDTGEVVKKAGRLRQIATGIGVPTLSAAVAGAVEAFVSLAVGGTFG